MLQGLLQLVLLAGRPMCGRRVYRLRIAPRSGINILQRNATAKVSHALSTQLYGLAFHLLRQADIAAGILMDVGIMEVHQVLMTAIVNLTMVDPVMHNVNLMAILIVMICKIVAEHRVIPRVSRIASPAMPMATTSAPISVVRSRSLLR